MADTSEEITIQQLNIAYHPAQDRLLLRIGLSDNGEYLLWITRRVVKSWWPLLQKSSHIPITDLSGSTADPAQRELIKAFAREAIAQKLDFSEPYQEARENRLQRPLLIDRLQLIDVGGSQQAFEFTALNGQQVRINLNTDLVLGLTQMLTDVIANTEWDLNLSETPKPIDVTLTQSVLH